MKIGALFLGRAQQRLARAPARCEAGGRTGGLSTAGVLCLALRAFGGGGGAGVPLPVRNPTTPFPRVLKHSALGRGAKSHPEPPHAHVQGQRHGVVRAAARSRP